MSENELRQCISCKEWKSKSEFYERKDVVGGDKLRGQCKACLVKAGKFRQSKRQDEVKEVKHLWYERNKERLKSKSREYYEANIEKVKKQADGWRRKNGDLVKGYARRYREGNRDKINDYGRRRYEGNSRKVLAINRRWQKENPEKTKDIKRRRRAREFGLGKGGLTGQQWEAILKYYGNICLCCGIKGKDTPEGYLTQDHIIPLIKGGTHQAGNVQPLCKSCNSRKAIKTIDFRPYKLPDSFME